MYDFSIEQPVDKIYKQDPLAAAIITKNTNVTIYISKGEDPEGIIPNVIGMTEVDALAALSNAGFKNVSVQYIESYEKDFSVDKNREIL
ncbi:MAG: PASTA domain-containing protein [Actinobacteria bacterium]|nr:PASTA domain-containing protein [Actinomycetota bacterium]